MGAGLGVALPALTAAPPPDHHNEKPTESAGGRNSLITKNTVYVVTMTAINIPHPPSCGRDWRGLLRGDAGGLLQLPPAGGAG